MEVRSKQSGTLPSSHPGAPPDKGPCNPGSRLRREAVRAPAAFLPGALPVGTAVTRCTAFCYLNGVNQFCFLHLAGYYPQLLGPVLDLGHRHPLRCRTRHCHVPSPDIGSEFDSVFVSPRSVRHRARVAVASVRFRLYLRPGTPPSSVDFAQNRLFCPPPWVWPATGGIETIHHRAVPTGAPPKPVALCGCSSETFVRPHRPFFVDLRDRKHYHMRYDVIGGNSMSSHFVPRNLP